MWIVIWKAYGEWKCTTLFKTEKAANKHADSYFRGEGKEHYERVTVRFVELPGED